MHNIIVSVNVKRGKAQSKGERKSTRTQNLMAINMKKEDFWWILWGIGMTFSLQVLYDGLGEYPNLSQKFWWGLIVLAISWILIFLYGPRAREGYDRVGEIELTEAGKTWIQNNYPQGIVWNLNLEEPFKIHRVAAEFMELSNLGVSYRIPHEVDGKPTIRKASESRRIIL